MEENAADGPALQPRPQNLLADKMIMFTFTLTAAISLGSLHYSYVAILFENDRNFLFLSNLEREMSLRTEMGFYYSYYKAIVEEKPLVTTLSQLTHDKMVEHPTEVNAFNRFNIHPDVMIGALYYYFEPWLNTTEHRVCHIIDRGEQSPVESCSGLGEPIFFYLHAIWILAGLTVTAIFLNAATLSESLLGGTLAVVQYFANHEEVTRVMWAPNERENMAMPLLLLQSWLLTVQLRNEKGRASIQLQIMIFIINGCCLVCWQFTQFIFLTQIIIFFIMEQAYIIDVRTLCIFLHAHFCGLHLAVLFLQGNEMLKASLYTSLFIVLSLYCLFFSSLRLTVQCPADFCIEFILVILRFLITGCMTMYVKITVSAIFDNNDDNHIFSLLYTKFTDYKSFDTLLYTCSDVFNFLPWSSIKNMTKTFLIPFALISSINMSIYWLRITLARTRECELREMEELEAENNREDPDDSGIENNADGNVQRNNQNKLIDGHLSLEDRFMYFIACFEVDPSIFYYICQMVVYGIMALLVMRLKLLFATQMCIVASLLVKFDTYKFPKWLNKNIPLALLFSTIPVFLYNARANMIKEMSYMGEYTDPAQEELLNWISNSTAPRSAFAGSMPILASVLLSTRRPIVAHPHYENSGARNRAYTVYGVYGRFSPEELYMGLTKLQVTYLIVEAKYCYGKSNTGCTFLDIWDTEKPENANQPSLCERLLEGNIDHFYPTFSNSEYTVFKLHDISVRYMPRSFDT